MDKDANGFKVVIAVGQFVFRKGFDVLLNAFAKCPKNYLLYIIGAEPTDEYIQLKEYYGLNNVRFVGFKTKEELKEYYMAADLFVLPTREDIWGLVINEAMANGLPVITTDRCVAGLDLVEDGVNGYIIPVEDADALADRVNRILGDEKLCRDMSEASLRKIRNYSIENMAELHSKVFQIALQC